MWNDLGPTDPDRASPEELAKDEVWSRLDRVLQLRAQDSLKGKPGPLHAIKCPIWYVPLFSFRVFFPFSSPIF